MTATPASEDIRSALCKAITTHAAQLGIDPTTVWCPSPHASAARQPSGSLLRIDFGEWAAATLGQ